jgi:hypothetical protein
MNSKYKTYLNSSKWHDKRSRKLVEAKNRCQLCYATGNLHVHHRTYQRIFEEWLSDLIVLCSSCHAKFHDKLPVVPKEEYICLKRKTVKRKLLKKQL